MVPRTFVLDALALLQSRQHVEAGDAWTEAPLAQLLAEADSKLKVGPFTVTSKTTAPASGDKQDYCSLGRYWWPDPTKPDGLPYIRKDGQPNPDRGKIGDAGRFSSMQKAVITLSYAWFFTGREVYAEHAAKLLRVWFLEPTKRMNPHLKYAQGIPGQCDGRGIGIIDSANLVDLVDAVGLLESSEQWTAEDHGGLVQWFNDFLEWLQTSKYGKDEDNTKNNHAIQYDAQLVSYALFVGKEEIGEQVMQRVPKRRIDSQIRPDGSQPNELSRENSWDYSCENLRYFARLAQLGRHVNVDLWAYEKKDGRSLKQAINYLVPYVNETPWPHKQLSKFEGFRLQKALMAAPLEMGFTLMAYKLLKTSAVERLLYPKSSTSGAKESMPAVTEESDRIAEKECDESGKSVFAPKIRSKILF